MRLSTPLFPSLSLLLLLLPPPTQATRFSSSCLSEIERATERSSLTLTLRADDWLTASLVTSTAAILLNERMGYDVHLVLAEGPTREVYRQVAERRVDAALEVWPAGKESQLEAWAAIDGSKPALVYFYPDVVATVGVYETCDRLGHDTETLGDCVSASAKALPRRLTPSLATPEGIAHFGSTRIEPSARAIELCTNITSLGCDVDGVFRPPVCQPGSGSVCGVAIYHVSPLWDTGVIESFVADSGLELNISYVGRERLSDEVWASHIDGRGGLFYGYEPSESINGRPMSSFPRVMVKPSIELPAPKLQRVINEELDLDARDFLAHFSLTSTNFDQLLELHALYVDVDRAACEFVKANKKTLFSWIKYPGRRHTPFRICSPSQLCDAGCWIGVGVQLLSGIACFFLASWVHRNDVEARKDHDRARKIKAPEVIDRVVRRMSKLQNGGPMPPDGESLLPSGERVEASEVAATDESEAVVHSACGGHGSGEDGDSSTCGAREDDTHGSGARPTRQPPAIDPSNAYIEAQGGRPHPPAPSIGSSARNSQGGIFAPSALVKRAMAVARVGDQSDRERRAFAAALVHPPNFLSHVRTYSNFAKSNRDSTLVRPPSYASERWIGSMKRSTVYLYIANSDVYIPQCLQSLGLALLSGAAGSLLYLILRWEAYRMDDVAFRQNQAVAGEDVIMRHAGAIQDITDSFKFYPSFLLMGYLGYSIGRWRQFLNYGYSIQGRIHDIALLTGGSLLSPGADENSRRFAYRIYRYLNLVHLLCYKTKSSWLSELGTDDLIALGLLTPDERAILEPMANKMRDTVLAWISKEVQGAIRSGIADASMSVPCLENVARLRGACGAFHDQFSTNHPNMWTALMKAVVDMLIFLYAIGMPAVGFVYSAGCFQPYCLAFTFFLVLPFICSQHLVVELSNPFQGNHDVFNVDSLMASTEQTIFATLRASFDHSTVDNTTALAFGKDAQNESLSVGPLSKVEDQS